MPGIRKKYIVLLIFAVIIAGAVIWIRSYVFEKLTENIQARIQSLTLSGFSVRYDSLRVDWLGNVIEIHNLILDKDAYDTTCVYPEYISVGKVRAEGIGLIKLIFRNVLELETVHLDSARIVLRQNSLLNLDSAARRSNEFTLHVNRLDLRSAQLSYTDSVQCNAITQITSHISLTGLDLAFHIDKPFAYAARTVTFDSAEVKVPASFYTFRVRQAVWNSDKKAFRADSIRVIPDLGKMEFGRKHGFEIDRFDCQIPSLAASGISATSRDSIALTVNLAEISFHLKVFRDKRLKFLRKEKPLPVALLRDLPFQLAIDTLKVLNSFVQYEEFAEGTTEPGGIYFDNLDAVLGNISNTTDTGYATLTARAKLFGEGDLTLYASFPYNQKRRSSALGSIRNFSLPKLNAILTPSTQLEIESGDMKELLFDFTFDANRSSGEVELNYRDLKLVTFKHADKTDGDEREKDNLKTFMMNTFVFRKNMTEDLPDDKRKGTISYVRDDARSIFNFWSKSLISGIKSAYNLDKVEENKSVREQKKEERNSRREARKQRRADRKRERG